MEKTADYKSHRVMLIYLQLQKGRVLKKSALARELGVTERSIQRDIEALREFLAEQSLPQEIVLDRRAGGYRLVTAATSELTNAELLTICKILLESRSLRRDEMLPILDKLVDCCIPQSSEETARQLIANEKFHYVEPHHGQPLTDKVWELGQAVNDHHVLEIQYQKLKGKEIVTRRIEPVGLVFSEFYFYLIGFIRNKDDRQELKAAQELYPAFYRVDRIRSFQDTRETFTPAYATRFQEGEFRKRIQFMFGGPLRTVRFTYSGPSIEAVLDRLPTAEVLEEKDGVCTIRTEVFGDGIDMWLKSQGEYVTVCR